MPVYQYACRDCGYQFEAKQSFHDDPLSICPTCKGRIHRVINPVGIIFKGSGFYITDNKKNGRNGAKGLNGSDKKSKVNGVDGKAKSGEPKTNDAIRKEAKTEKATEAA